MGVYRPLLSLRRHRSEEPHVEYQRAGESRREGKAMTPEALAMMADDIYEVVIANRRYLALRFQGEEISVRIPLEVWSSENPTLYGPYAEELLRKIMKLANSKAAVTKASLTLPM